jgi:hypothetical protein
VDRHRSQNKELDDDTHRTITQTRQYLHDAEQLLASNTTALDFFNAMLERHPHRLNPGALWSGAVTLYR